MIDPHTFPRDVGPTTEPEFTPSSSSGLGLVGVSPRMREVITQVELAGADRKGVCVTGEPGTGRELVARAIHRCGVTATEAFVPVWCNQIQPGDADDLLFGPKAPGARRPSSGPSCESVATGSLLHQAIGGTLYLHHPEELPDRVQARLARLLRDGEVVIGTAADACPLRIRPVAAFDPDPQHHVAEGRVRYDFFRRVSTYCIGVPPLRYRREDIPLLAAHFLARTCLAAGLPAKRLTAGAATLLSALPWPGNNHDLHAVLAAVVRSTAAQEVDLDVLLGHIHLDGSSRGPAAAHSFSGTLRDARLEFEREHITAVLAQHHGRIPEAAQALGIQRTNLYRKLRALRLPKSKSQLDPAGG